MEIIQCLLSDYGEIKLEINNRQIAGKSPNPWRLKNTLIPKKKVLITHGSSKKSQEKFKNILS